MSPAVNQHTAGDWGQGDLSFRMNDILAHRKVQRLVHGDFGGSIISLIKFIFVK